MLIGLDVGGTYTDAVLIDGALEKIHLPEADGLRLKTVKVPTRPGDVLPGIVEALSALLENEDPSKVVRLCVSSTLGLNALLTGKADVTGVLAVPGPGIDPRAFWGEDPLFRTLTGAQDHRGIITRPVNGAEVKECLAEFKKQNISALAVVCKFSPKNPEVEYQLRDQARKELASGMPMVCGSEVSGTLNFPRRLHTAYCNAALARTGREFTDALFKAAKHMGLTCPVVILKADAGVFSNEAAASEPASTMGSGPAASLLGVWALTAPEEDIIMADIGGTTTDLALLAKGQPLLAREGLTVADRPTVIRSLWTRSVALGGDSALRMEGDTPTIGPDRLGVAIALAPGDLGLRPPTLTDALNVLGHTKVGDPSLSHKALEDLAVQSGRPAGSLEGTRLAERFIQLALERIKTEADLLLAEINTKPVYTIKELLVEDPLAPGEAVFIGGPAEALAPLAQKAWNMPVLAPRESACANAVGAALARPTRMADLYADTAENRMSMAALGVEKVIDRGYNIENAKEDALAALEKSMDLSDELPLGLARAPARPQVVFAESFQMLDDHGRRGRIIKVRAQLAAGLLSEGGAQ